MLTTNADEAAVLLCATAPRCAPFDVAARVPNTTASSATEPAGIPHRRYLVSLGMLRMRPPDEPLREMVRPSGRQTLGQPERPRQAGTGHCLSLRSREANSERRSDYTPDTCQPRS